MPLSNKKATRQKTGPACIPCHRLKIKCDGEVKPCQSCVRRKVPKQCAYPRPILHSEKRGETRPQIETQEDQMGSSGSPGPKLDDPASLLQPSTVPASETTRSDVPEFPHHAVSSFSPEDSADPGPPLNTSFLQMAIPVSTKPLTLPQISLNHLIANSSATLKVPSHSIQERALLPHCPDGCEHTVPTFHQLLLVLGYLCLTSIIPEDDGALWNIICRREQDWEHAFILQYDHLLPWLLPVRRALTEAKGLHTMSLMDIQSQIRFLLYIIGIYSVPQTSFLQTCFQQRNYPYRPFGIKASIVLICLAFGVIRASEIKDYESRSFWPQHDSFLSLMVSRLAVSPLFENGSSKPCFSALIRRLYQSCQLEEIHVASIQPWRILLRNEGSIEAYYRQGFRSLNPLLLPKIADTLGVLSNGEYQSSECLISSLATTFLRSEFKELDQNFSGISEIKDSKADRILVTEMLHVQLSRALYRSEPGRHIMVFHVSNIEDQSAPFN
ncbi:hypothetical protein N7540_013154 [Penicillium herquei]|nr:hypothetical protein N7540_013154 [Penicillium herquei]